MVDVSDGSLAPSYDSGEKGRYLLDLRIKLTCAPGCQAQGWSVDISDFTLTGPDGKVLAPDNRSQFCCEALYPETVSDSKHNVLTFVVPTPGTGSYTLTYSQPAQTDAGLAPATLAFTA